MANSNTVVKHVPIQQLPPRLANQIAAGEVVERPASVVKELVENSIDAGATQIQIDIEKGGARRIRIRDDGSGISSDELELALSRHATSKISTLDDLEAIASLGFRGEALASISSVSRLTLTSKPPQQDMAWQAFCEGRDMAVQTEPATHPDGTTVDVTDLFFNTPARRKFLRTEKTEFSHVDEVVRRIALGNPSVGFTLSHNGKILRRYSVASNADAAGQLAKRLEQVAGKRFCSEAIYVEHAAEPFRLSGWMAPPEHCRHQNDVQYVYVNGRMMKDKLLSHAIRQSYGQLLNDDRVPTYILYFELPARDVDVNVHPAKHEVRFHQSRQVHDYVLSVLQGALAQTALQQDSSAITEMGTGGHNYQPPDPSRYQRVESQRPGGAGFEAARSKGSGFYSSGAYNPGNKSPADSASRVSTGNRQSRPGTGLPSEKAWGMYAIANQEAVSGSGTGNGLLPVCLHADHWLVVQSDELLGLVDVCELQRLAQAARFQKQLEPGLAGQPLLLPVKIRIKNAATLISQYHQVTTRLGFQLKPGKQDQVTVMQVPEVLRKADISTVLAEFFRLLAEQPTDVPPGKRSDIVSWLAGYGVVSQYTPDKALYWWQQACELVGLREVESLVKTLDWQSAVQNKQ